MATAKQDVFTHIVQRLFVAFLIFVALWILIPWIHELAHAAVCEWSGYNSKLNILITGETHETFCSGKPQNENLYHAAGGIAGLAASSALAFGIRKQRLLFTAAFPFVAQQALIVCMETFAYSWYIPDDNPWPTTLASVLTLGLFAVLCAVYAIITYREKGSTPRQDDIQ